MKDWMIVKKKIGQKAYAPKGSLTRKAEHGRWMLGFPSLPLRLFQVLELRVSAL